jgi:DNA-directed RNA polymerase specialized sigma24 family protein
MSHKKSLSTAGRRRKIAPLCDRDIAERLRSPAVKSDEQLFLHIVYNLCPRVEAVLIGTYKAQPGDAQDAIANGLARLWEGAIAFESLYAYTPGGASFQTWFAAVARNELRRIWSASGRTAPLDGDVVDHRSDDTTGEGAERRVTEHADAVERVAELRETLSPKDRRIVDEFLKSGGGVGPWATNLSKEMEGDGAMTPNHIRVRFHRILDRLRNIFVVKQSSHSRTDRGP